MLITWLIKVDINLLNLQSPHSHVMTVSYSSRYIHNSRYFEMMHFNIRFKTIRRISSVAKRHNNPFSCISTSIHYKSYLLANTKLYAETASFPKQKRLNEESMSQSLRTMEYAVRGKVVIAADQINEDLKAGNSKNRTFDHIVYTNIGNPHSVGQLPLTWPRQVLALAELPDEVGVAHPNAKNMFPEDAIERAVIIKEALNGHGTGAYTHSQGPLLFREEICRFIEQRDELPFGTCQKNDIFLTNGASSGIEMVLKALIAERNW